MMPCRQQQLLLLCVSGTALIAPTPSLRAPTPSLRTFSLVTAKAATEGAEVPYADCCQALHDDEAATAAVHHGPSS